MGKVAIVYWSATGNTEACAKMVEAGVRQAGGEAVLYTPDAFSEETLAGYEAVALGCPAMGAEVLEEAEFQPMYDSIRSSLAGKKVGLFGSYGWGSGEWMDTWAADVNETGCLMAADPVIVNYAPDGEAEAKLQALGAALAS